MPHWRGSLEGASGMEGNVKLKDIAKALGVSVVTVSNALSGKKGVSDQVRREAVEKARELGYDLHKYEKRKSDSAKIGVLVSEKYVTIGVSFYWALYQQVACAASARQSFTMIEIAQNGAEESGELPKLLTEGAVDGLIIIGRMEEAYMEKVIAAAGVPVVLLDYHNDRFPCLAVMSNNYLGMYRATRYLLERGHREIAFVGSVKATDNIMDRYYGYCKGLREYGIPIRRDWVIEDRDLESGVVSVALPEHMPTAFVCNCDNTAGVLYDRLAEAGLRVPEDVSVTGYDDYLFNHVFSSSLTTYHVDMEEMARLAVKLLLRQVRKKEGGRGVRYVDGFMVERGSVKNMEEA